MHPLVPIIRWWLLQLAAIMTALWWPEAGLVLFGGNCFGWWPGDGCCSVPTVTCGRCQDNNAPGNGFEVDISGVADGSCHTCASTGNGVFLCTFHLSDDGSGGCHWEGNSNICTIGSVPKVRISKSGADRIIGVEVYNAFGDDFTWTGTGQDGADCLSINQSLSSAGTLVCDLTSATCTVISS